MNIIKTKTVFTCPIFKVEERIVELPGGRTETHWVVIRQPNVSIVALTNDKKFVLIKELRGKHEHLSIEIPSGKMNEYDPSKEKLRKQALQELREEAGFRAHSIELLDVTDYESNWRERTYYQYVAWDLEKVGQKLESGENIKVILVTLKELEQFINSRKHIIDDHEIDALQKGIVFFRKKQLL